MPLCQQMALSYVMCDRDFSLRPKPLIGDCTTFGQVDQKFHSRIFKVHKQNSCVKFEYFILLYYVISSKNEKENAAKEQEIICPTVIKPAIINEFTIKRNNGTVLNASIKF